jgi:hypothetical protein
MEGSLVAYKVFTNGSVLNGSEINDNLMNQAVITFTNSTARASAITSPLEGQITYLEDVDRYESYSGTAWVQVITPGAWVAYTPSFSNFTLGNGTVSAFFTRIGRTVIARVRIVLGSTSSMGSFPNLSLPVASKTGLPYPTLGSGILIIEDAGTRDFFGKMRITSTTTADFVTDLVQGTGIGVAFLNATTPMTWAVNDALNFQIIYEAGA